jgi:hypothetical protein
MQMSTPSAAEAEDFERFALYHWDDDSEYRNGLSTLLKDSGVQSDAEAEVLKKKTKVFYFKR